MNIGFVFGKGIDGCGVTRGALIFEKWLREAGHKTGIFDFDNMQGMKRSKYINFIGKTIKIESDVLEVDDKIIDIINTRFDILIFHSYPTQKQDQKFVVRFRKFLEKINGPIMVMHEHGIASININSIPEICYYLSLADFIVPQNLNGITANAMKMFDSSLESRLIENPIWIDSTSLDVFQKQYDDRKKKIICLGRMSPLKDPAMICRLDQHLANDWELCLMGCEKSIASVSEYAGPYQPRYANRIRLHIKSKTGYNTPPSAMRYDADARIYAYDNYEYNFGMEALANSLFSWCGYKLKDVNEYGNRMEYSMIESYLLTLPIINVHFAENAKSPEGKLWGQYYGPLQSCRGQEEELSKIMTNMSKNEWNDRTASCREIIKKFNEVSVLAPKFLDRIAATGKNNNKKNMHSFMKSWFTDLDARLSCGDVIICTPNSLFNKKIMILSDNKQLSLEK